MKLKRVRSRVEKSLRQIFGSWHACALGTKYPLHPEDRDRGLKKGDLCDDCNGQIAAHLKYIFSDKSKDSGRLT